MCPRYILSDNGTEFKNHLMEQVLPQLWMDCIFSAPYPPQSNGKLEVVQKYLKPTLKKLCKTGSIKVGQIYQPSSHKLQVNTQLCHSRNAIFPHLWQKPKPTITPTSRTNAMIPKLPRIWFTQPGSTLSSPSHCQENTR